MQWSACKPCQTPAFRVTYSPPVSPVLNRSCTGIRSALASSFAGLPLWVIDNAGKLTFSAPTSEDLPLPPLSLRHRVTQLRGEAIREKTGGESRISARDNSKDSIWERRCYRTLSIAQWPYLKTLA